MVRQDAHGEPERPGGQDDAAGEGRGAGGAALGGEQDGGGLDERAVLGAAVDGLDAQVVGMEDAMLQATIDADTFRYLSTGLRQGQTTLTKMAQYFYDRPAYRARF